MKSKRAIDYINKNKEYMIDSSIQTGYYIANTKIMIQAVYLAEQDAEERAVEAANLLYEDLKPILLHPMAREWVIDKFKEFYNDGGQSDDE